MHYRLFAAVLLPAFIAGCSVYDVTNISADVALALFSDVNEGKQPDDPGYIRFWDPEISQCIVIEKDVRKIAKQLDAFEQGRDFILLPTGELYPVSRSAGSQDTAVGPTAECLARHSD